MRSKVLVIGMNPSRVVEVRKNSTLDRLNQWMSHVGVENYSFMNAVSEKGEVSHKDVDYKSLKDATTGYKYVVALGGFASKSLCNIKVSHFKLPHPSPRNRQLNDKTKLALTLMALQEYIGGYDGN